MLVTIGTSRVNPPASPIPFPLGILLKKTLFEASQAILWSKSTNYKTSIGGSSKGTDRKVFFFTEN